MFACELRVAGYYLIEQVTAASCPTGSIVTIGTVGIEPSKQQFCFLNIGHIFRPGLTYVSYVLEERYHAESPHFLSLTVSLIARILEASCRLSATAALCFGLVALTGCGGEVEAKLEDYLLELEFETPLESTHEIELGSYSVSIAARPQEVSRKVEDRVWVKIRFHLYAVVDPENESAVKSEIARHRGLLDDTIVSVCRNASLEELADNRWAILKSRIIDHIRPILGQDRLRQLVVINNIPERI